MGITDSDSDSKPTGTPTPAHGLELDADRIARVDATYDRAVGTVTDFEKQKTAEGEAHFRRLGWKRLTVILVVEAIGLGTFSLPAAFATLGVVAGTFCCIVLGLLAIYTGYIVGKVSVVYPSIHHYGDIGGLLMGRFGEELFGFLYVLQLILMTSSFMLTGTIAFNVLSDYGACGLVFSVVSGILLFVLAIMPSFTEAAILGYLDLVSVVSAIGITIIASGIEAADSPGGLGNVNWSAWPAPDATFKDGMVAICNMLFAYCFAMFLTPFMSEMHTPTDYMKSVWTLGIIEIVVYTATGVLIYVFVGADVESPSLLSLSSLLSKIAFGVALPIIFISGAIGNTVTARYVHIRLYKDSVTRFINTPKGWITWLAVLAAITVVSWIIGEGIPIFNDLLSLSSALFVSGFVLYFPAIMWYKLLCEGHWYERKNLFHASACLFAFLFGLLVLFGGTYASVKDIQHHYAIGSIRSPFSC
ncbi:transmembrane amino acid transporter protein-domain-containing protein [Ilyonectria robusta]|uniref:transmembrane amino acid transporter protein-domain-containing protein n=1 Tax=Ilyonectria robusta TaxID=1079257 RepID=UPI001E8D3952|nr:transmembrane amino acid transporter protein-domain-containing protein [Ilyonectria robusta]KAH8714718.1 transmembrane amino acid transporter protein-domain-containing protein [Ilyonectria robusta]